MAEIIDNQPIVFNPEDECWLEDSEFHILAQYGDVTQFQMKLEPCGTDLNLIQNGELDGSTHWNTFGGWSINNGVATHTLGAPGQLSQSAPVSNGTMTRLTFDYVATDNTRSIRVSYQGQQNYIFNTGSYEFWIEGDSSIYQSLVFTADSATACSVSNIQLISINTNFSVAILDLDNTPITQIDQSTGYLDFTNGYFTASIDWEALSIPDGCYRLALVDPCPCGQRGIVALDLVSSVFEWQITNNWTIGSGVATYNDSGNAFASLLNNVCSGKTYKVTYTIAGMTTGNEEFRFGLGSSYGTMRTANGTYTEQITSNGDRVRLWGSSASGTQTYTVGSISIEEVIPSSILFSNVIKVQEEFSCRTLALSLCGDSDSLGFGFEGTGFKPLMRIPASLTRSSYPMERLSYDNSIGRKSTYYARSRKARELGFDGDVYVHDFAHLFGMADHFYIDDVEYFVEEDEYPSISWGEDDNVGGVTLQVSKKVQLVENRRLNSSSIGCSDESLELEDASGEPIKDQVDSIIETS
jgi:hypothetical protein